MESKMWKSFILVVILVVTLALFAEGSSKEPHTCLDYDHARQQVGEIHNWGINFISDWFDHLEEADDNSDYSKDFLQEHGGRAGTLVYRYKIENDVDCEESDDNYEENDDDPWEYGVMCSGTLIGENYFLTAGHCAVTKKETQDGCAKIKHLGVLFGYQKADLEDNDEDYEINDDDSLDLEYPRVSLKGYLNNDNDYILYDDPESEYPNYTEHPAYFPLSDDDIYNDGSVEHGWKMNDNDSDKVDYAIYKLEINSNQKLPFEDDDPWLWYSDNNQLFQSTLPINLVAPWQLPDNTNGHRGWARVNTEVLPTGSTLNVIGHPGVATIFDGKDSLRGIKIVNAGSVIDGATKRNAHSYKEDVLVFERADIWYGNSGSSVIDYSGRLAGVVAWFGCFEGGNGGGPKNNIVIPPLIPIYPVPLNATNYATPMWRICQVSQIIKNAAKDMDCNGRIDWWDEMEKLRSFSGIIKIGDIWFGDLDFSSSANVKNYRYDSTQQKVVTETSEIPANTYQVAWADNSDFFYVVKQSNIYSLFKNGTSLGTIINYPPLSGSATLVKGDDIYLAGGNLSGGISDYFPGVGNNSFVPYVTKISSNGRDYSLSVIAEFPTSLEDVRIFELGNNIYVAGNTTTNFVIYKLVADNQSEFGYSLSLVSDTTQPVRKDYNLTASDGKIIVSGGATDYISTVLNLDEEDYPSTFAVFNNIIMLEAAVSNNWVTVAENINDKLIMMSVTAIEDGKLIIVNPFISVGNSMQKIVMDLSEIPINGEHLRVDFEFDPLVYCLAESEETLSGGIGTSGECVPFTHPWYSSFSAGATVYSLSGKGERLYVGTNNAIKVYDISDPISPVLLSSFSTSSRVNDLEVYGDALFVATNSGLYKLDASNDTLTQTLFVSAFLNYQYKVEVYNGKLYVGEDNGIKVRDLDTLSVITSVNNGSVLDFAIENGEIGLYKDALFSPVEIRDADTLTLKANEFFGCFEIEVGSSFGRFYLSCDDETYRFEYDGDGGISFTELSGDIRELQDVYTFDGYTYLYNENTIWISTSNDVPAICGNGIVEGDEVCDGAPIDCSDLDSNYVSGTAACNSTCDGYNTNNCSDDGW